MQVCILQLPVRPHLLLRCSPIATGHGVEDDLRVNLIIVKKSCTPKSSTSLFRPGIINSSGKTKSRRLVMSQDVVDGHQCAKCVSLSPTCALQHNAGTAYGQQECFLVVAGSRLHMQGRQVLFTVSQCDCFLGIDTAAC